MKYVSLSKAILICRRIIAVALMFFFWQPCLLRCSWLQRLNQDLLSLMLCFRLYGGFSIYFYNSFKISEHMSAWTHLINLNMVIARFIWPDYALEVNYKICSVLRYMGQADMILVRFFPNQILLEVNMVNLSVFLPDFVGSIMSTKIALLIPPSDMIVRSLQHKCTTSGGFAFQPKRRETLVQPCDSSTY